MSGPEWEELKDVGGIDPPKIEPKKTPIELIGGPHDGDRIEWSGPIPSIINLPSIGPRDPFKPEWKTLEYHVMGPPGRAYFEGLRDPRAMARRLDSPESRG